MHRSDVEVPHRVNSTISDWNCISLLRLCHSLRSAVHQRTEAVETEPKSGIDRLHLRAVSSETKSTSHPVSRKASSFCP